MPGRVEPINAILYAQYHLKGGLRNTLIGIGLLTLFVGGGCVLLLSVNPERTARVARDVSYMILALQWLMLGLYGATRVHAAVKADVGGGLIESHRLTPTAPLAAACGYVVGGAVQALALAVPMFGIGLAMCLIGGVSWPFWIAANLLALSTAATVWTLVALLAFVTTNAVVLPVLSVALVLLNNVADSLPATMVLGAPLIDGTIFNPSRGISLVPASYLFSAVAQGLIVGVMLLAIARRYRNADTPAFSVPLGLLLLGLFSAITVIGMAEPAGFLPTQYRHASPVDLLIFGLLSTFVVATVPLLAIARQTARHVLAPQPGRRLPAIALVVLCVAAAVAPSMLPLPFVTPRLDDLLERRLGTLVVAVAMFAGLAWLMAWQLIGGPMRLIIPLLFVLLPNALPPVVEAAISAGDSPDRHAYQYIEGFSPAGALVLLWARSPDEAWPGLVGQAGLSLLPAALYFRRRRRITTPERGFAVEAVT